MITYLAKQLDWNHMTIMCLSRSKNYCDLRIEHMNELSTWSSRETAVVPNVMLKKRWVFGSGSTFDSLPLIYIGFGWRTMYFKAIATTVAKSWIRMSTSFGCWLWWPLCTKNAPSELDSTMWLFLFLVANFVMDPSVGLLLVWMTKITIDSGWITGVFWHTHKVESAYNGHFEAHLKMLKNILWDLWEISEPTRLMHLSSWSFDIMWCGCHSTKVEVSL